MKTFATLCCLGVLGQHAIAGDADLKSWAEKASSADSRVAAEAVIKLRGAGQKGLDLLVAKWATPIKSKELRTRLSWAINEVGKQYDCHSSRLFWHTDLAKAKAEAARTGKPILSLRMLGKLNEECSCANSRFFRAALYANKSIGKELRDNYVLHWKSVRPVPVVTIDFGDGRVVKRTLTGNSIHYILDSKGRVIEALPGLYAPKIFLKYLQIGKNLAKGWAKYSDKQLTIALQQWHALREQELLNGWKGRLAKIEAKRAAAAAKNKKMSREEILKAAIKANPNAFRAGLVARGKGAVELPIILRVANWAEKTKRALTDKTDEKTWLELAKMYAEESKLDAGSISLIREHNPTAIRAGRVAPTKRLVEDPLLRVVRIFQDNIALDTVRNEYLLHSQIHRWFRLGKAPATLDQLNDQVYAKLFLTPKSDPWLGLVPENIYTGIKNNGLVSKK